MTKKVKCTKILKDKIGNIVGYRLSDGNKERDVDKEELKMAIDNALIEVTNMKRPKEYDMDNMENVFRHVKGETMDMSDLKEKN